MMHDHDASFRWLFFYVLSSFTDQSENSSKKNYYLSFALNAVIAQIKTFFFVEIKGVYRRLQKLLSLRENEFCSDSFVFLIACIVRFYATRYYAERIHFIENLRNIRRRNS